MHAKYKNVNSNLEQESLVRMFPVQYFTLKANNQYEIFLQQGANREYVRIRTKKNILQRGCRIMRFHWLFDSQ